MSKSKSYDEETSEEDLTTVVFEDDVEEGDSGEVEAEVWDEEVIFTPDFELTDPQEFEAPKDEGVVFTGKDKNGRLTTG